MDRTFTVDEARAVLADSRPSIGTFVGQRADFAELRWSLERETPSALGGVAELKALEARLEMLLSTLRDRGIQVKGIAPLLLDFPAAIDGRAVLLCWLEGEPELAWYHRLELGIMGRRRL